MNPAISTATKEGKAYYSHFQHFAEEITDIVNVSIQVTILTLK